MKRIVLLFAVACPVIVSAAPPPASAATLESACRGGEARACGQLAALYMDGRDVPKNRERGMQLFQMACDKNDPPACATLGTIYKDGLETPKDAVRAIGYFERACKQGYAKACTLAGVLHKTATPRDAKRAAFLFEVGCRDGAGTACMELALMTHDGDGVAKDERRARALLTRACELHEMTACNALKNTRQ